MWWLRITSFLTGRPVVVLIDHDGGLNFRLAYSFNGSIYADRCGFGIRTVRLLDSGEVEVGCYCVKWRYA